MKPLIRATKLAIVGGMAILLATVLMSGDDDPAVARSSPAARSRAQAKGSDETPLGDVKLELLRRPPGTLEEPGRNPFRFEGRAAAPAPEAPAGRGPAPAAGSGAPSRGVTTPSQPVAPAGPPPPPPIPLRFIGLVDAPSQAGRVAIMSDGKGNVFYGKEGDTIEGRYRMLKIAPDSAELAYVDGRGRQTIRLSGQ
jgi:hypothetical protein